MPHPRNDDDLLCSCGQPGCTITSLWRRASAAAAEQPAVPEPLPFDLSDTAVTDIGWWYRVPAPSPLLPPPLRPVQRVA
jgi:ATP-dependent helicase YprA (DUF1998 family)